MLLKSVLILSLCVHFCYSANILFFFALSTYSHRIAYWPLAEELAAAGHKLTFIQPFKPMKPNPNITEFFPEDLLQSDDQGFSKFDFLNLRLTQGKEYVKSLAKMLPVKGLQQCKSLLENAEFQQWIQRSKFDLVFLDSLFNECGYGLAHKFKAKTIILCTTHPFTWTYETFGAVMETSWIPEMHHAFPFPMTFWERLSSTLVSLLMYYGKILDYYPKLDKVFQEAFQDTSIPPVAQLERETSLVFTNTHFSEELGRSLPPSIIPVAGMYCGDATQKLPKDLEDFIDASSKDGFIYVSFGSAANVAKAPEAFQKIFHDVMRDSKQRFVWKYEGERPAQLSTNVYTSSWLPQQAVLAHPKIKAFVTHGGILGIHEAIWNAVPMIAMPVFAEQDYNALRVHATERGIMLDVNSLTYDAFMDTILQVTTNPKYKANAVRASKQFRDRPQRPRDTAIWWTEYVLRTDQESLKALKPLGIHQTWYERRLLDVWGFLGFLLLVVNFILSYIIMRLLRYCCCSSRKSSNQASASSPTAKKSN